MPKKEYPRGSGLHYSEINNLNKGKQYSKSYRIDVPKKYGLPARYKQFRSLKEAKQFCENLDYNYKVSGKGLRGISESQMSEVQLAFKRCEKHNVSLTEVLDYALPRMNTKGSKVTLSELVNEYTEIKYKDDLEEVTKKTIKYRYSKILELVGDIKIADIHKGVIKETIVSVTGKSRNKLNYYSYFSTLMTYAASMGYIISNPFNSISEMEKRMLLGKNAAKPERINILSLDDTKLILNAALANPQLNMLPNIVMQLFCGVRADEAEKLEWEDIRLNSEQPFIVIDESIAKNKSIRTAAIPPNAVKWLSLCDQSTPIGHKNLQQRNNYYRTLLQKMGWGTWTKRKDKKSLWKNRKGLKNVLRHSFGSYHFELYGDASETAKALGHSDSSAESVLFSNYRKLITKKGEGKKYFNICPKLTKC